jgi:hypothetical protein
MQGISTSVESKEERRKKNVNYYGKEWLKLIVLYYSKSRISIISFFDLIGKLSK